MPAYEIEIILNRQLADCLSMPVFITDIIGNLIFYNEPAEKVLGTRFEVLQGKSEKISVTSYPIIGRAGKFLGAVAIFWEVKDL